jgi:hypothetical protein
MTDVTREELDSSSRVTALRRSGRNKPAPYASAPRPEGAVVRELLPVSDADPASAEEALRQLAPGDRRLSELALRLREQIEIERVRDLEISRLEVELDLKNSQISALSDQLFHANRRADDLDRRWNELAATYEEAAAHLVEAGAQLAAIHSQSGYRILVALNRLVRRRPALYQAVHAVTSRLAGRTAG